jgi:DNA repair exonuclease SbcCD ATPase subunit
MKIQLLEIENFLAISEARIELADRGLLLIQGENKDDTSATSNGSGKSSIVDAICWALYGTTARGESGDSVVNDTTKKNTRVALTLTEEGKDGYYVIQRHRKHKTGKNSLLVGYAEDVAVTPKDISKGTDKETQQVVDTVIGCSLDVFRAAIYAGQESMPDLPGMTDKQLKLLLEEAAGTEVLAAGYTEALRRKQAIADAKTLAEGKLYTARQALALTTNELMTAEAAVAVFETSRPARAKTILTSAIQSRVEAEKELAACLDATTFAAYENESAQIDAELASYKALAALADGYAATLSKLKAQQAGLARDVANAETTRDSRVKVLANIKHMVGKDCNECGRPHTAEDIKKLAEAQAKQASAAVEALKTAKSNLAALDAHVEAAQKLADDARAALPDVSAQTTRRATLDSALREHAAHKAGFDHHSKVAEQYRAEAKSKLTESNPHKATALRLSEQVSSAASLVKDREREVEEIGGNLEIALQTAEVFGPAGVRAHILDTVTPFLNDRTRDYLATLSDGNIGAVWTTLATTAKGELREKFNIEVSNDKGGKSFGLISGGEKRKVRLACAMALQDLVAARATKPIGLFLADEIDDAMDDAGLERLMTVLNTKAKERGTVMVISHNSLSDWISQVITVTKSGGLATVGGDV